VEGSFAEVHPKANSYRGEILGLLALHLFSRAIQTYFGLAPGKYGTVCCDNKGAIYRASRRRRRIAPGTPNADLLRVLRLQHHKLGRVFGYEHVKGHQDDYLVRASLSLEAHLNCRCDDLAKQAVDRNWQTRRETTSQLLPDEAAAVFVGGVKQTSEVGDNVRFEVGKQDARRFYVEELGWSGNAFDAVDWEGLDITLSSKPKMFHVWLCKQASGFCATGQQMGRWFGRDFTACPNCGCECERAEHLLHCPDEGRTQHFHECVDRLAHWLHNNHTDSQLAFFLLQYIRGRGELSLRDLPNLPQHFSLLHSQLSDIGWSHVLEGKVPTELRRLQAEHLAGSSSMMTIDTWIKTLISHLLHITHSQWIYRNISLHHHRFGAIEHQERHEHSS
jgi:hypothetical protein